MSDGPGSTNPRDWRALYPFTSHYLELDGPRMHYLDEGDGAPVVMLHGNPTWSFYYRHLVCGLRDSCRVVVPDHIGCGLSDKPQDYSYCLSQHVRNTTRLLNDHLGLEDITLVVHDWGGAIGMAYAESFPERVRRLVILNTAAFLQMRCPLRIRICKTPLFGTLAIRGLNAFARAAVRMAVVAPSALSPAAKAGYLAPYDNFRTRIATQRFVQDIPLNPGHPTWPVVEGIQNRLNELADKPMLICWGEQDFCFTTSVLDAWQQFFPNATVHRFADAGHYVLEEAHERILPLIRQFIAP